ncbi:hypothetical protein MMC26_003549 [Xylographa opegraphella]|nr:hypothetical protein [Xylographa opegraphella]
MDAEIFDFYHTFVLAMLFHFLLGSIIVVNLSSVLAAVQFKGVNIAGFDFGCSTDGTCITTNVYGALRELNGPDGAGQMLHFTNANNFNLYRLPVAWQYLVNNVLGGPLDSTYSENYDMIVQACLATGSHCLIDIHNYARWNGAIIGQGGPTNDQFASLWSQLATKYASESKVLFGLMNEPHDLPDIHLWAASVQAAVTAIRTAGATSQIILLPGNDYTSAESFVSGGSAAALCDVTNPDGSKTNLVFDVHKYFDSDGSGTSADCVSNQIDTSFSPLADYLRANNRQALLSETGGGSSNADCLVAVCQALSYLDANSDVYLGYTGWAAGSFATDYVLSMTPSGNAAGGWTDQELVSQCFARGATGSNSTTTVPASTTATSLATTTSATDSSATRSLETIATQATTTSMSSTVDSVPLYSTGSTSSVPMTTSFPYSFSAAAVTYPGSPVSTISSSSVSTTSFPYSFSAAAVTYPGFPVSTISSSSVSTTSFPYSFSAAAVTSDSAVSTISTSSVSTTSFPYSFSAAAVTFDSAVSTISTSSVSTTSFPYSFSAAAITYSDSAVSTTCACTLSPTSGSGDLPTSSTSTAYAYAYTPASSSDSGPALYSTSTPASISVFASTTFEYSYVPAPTTISTSTSANLYAAESSVTPSTTTVSVDTAASTTEIYSFAPAPTGETTQLIPGYTATPSGFTTMVRPSGTDEAGPGQTGGSGEENTCSS